MFDPFKREKEEHKAKSENESDEEPRPYLTSLHNLLHSLFSVCEDYSNTIIVYNATRLYLQGNQVLNKVNSSAVSNKETIAGHGYGFKEFLAAIDLHPFCDRAISSEIV